VSPSEKIDDYARGWSDLMTLVRNGYSWSGGERNRFFRNGGGSFHEMSHLAGLDGKEDGRGLALVDWDQDGRLDLWYRNRSAPRLRLMMNRREGGGSVAIKLEGTSANRDGIGAVVELFPAPKEGRLVRSVRAGDLFLSQSGKCLHFGVGGEEGITHAEVIWPGGERERFSGVKAGGRFLLKQGTGKAVAMAKREEIEIRGSESGTEKGDGGLARVILPARIPMPTVRYRQPDMKRRTLVADGKARLLILWSGACQQCQKEMKELAGGAGVLAAANIEVLALSVDALAGPGADSSEAYDLIDSSGFPFPWGLLDTDSAGRIHGLQEKLFDRTPESAVPLAFLLDEAGQAIAIYRGSIEIKKMVADWEMVRRANMAVLWHLAPPMKGTWFTNPLPPGGVRRVFGVGE
jgi:hypothetical protein